MLVSIARITKPFGLDGRVRAILRTDYPKDRFKKGKVYPLYDDNGVEVRKLTLSYHAPSKGMYLLGFKEVKTPEEAELLRNLDVMIDEEEAPLPEGTYRIKDLVGCKVVDEKGNELGTLKDVLQYGPTDNFRIARPDGPDFFVPFVYDEFVLDVDIDRKTITIKVVEGMI